MEGPRLERAIGGATNGRAWSRGRHYRLSVIGPKSRFLSRWLSLDEETSTRLCIFNLSRLGRWTFAALIPAFFLGALPESGWQLVELVAFTIFVGAFLCRFAWARVVVTREGVTYVGLLRTRRWRWSEIDGFFSSINGVELAADGQVVGLMPTKRISWRSETTMSRVDALCTRVTSYAPDPSKYAVQGSAKPPSNVRRVD